MRKSIGVACFLMILGLFLFGCGGGGTSVPITTASNAQAPVVSFEASKTVGEIPFGVSLIDTSTKNPTWWKWYDNDLLIGISKDLSYTISTAGNHIIKLEAGNVLGSSSANTVIVGIESPIVINPPVADFTVNVSNGNAPLAVQVTDQSSASSTNWLWSFGDGTISNLKNPASHTYANPGVYTLSVTVSNSGGSNSKSIIIDVKKAELFSVIPANEYSEAINVLEIDSYANTLSAAEFQANAKEYVDGASLIFAKNTQKRYTLHEAKKYSAGDFSSLTTNPINFFDNGFSGNWGGLTIIHWTYANASELPAKFSQYHAMYEETTLNGKRYGIVYVAESTIDTVMMGRAKLTLSLPTSYDLSIMILCHELGHSLLAGIPEWYWIIFTDNSGTLPNLSPFSFEVLYPNDPMYGALRSLGYNQKLFAGFNARLINLNANHNCTRQQYFAAESSMPVYVKVVDAQGSAISGANVAIYGGVQNGGIANNMLTNLQTLTTDSSGQVQMTNDFVYTWSAKGVKAYYGGKSGAAVITAIDVQDALISGKDKAILTVTIE